MAQQEGAKRGWGQSMWGWVVPVLEELQINFLKKNSLRISAFFMYKGSAEANTKLPS